MSAPIEPVRVHWTYRLALLAVGLTNLVLPLIYLAFIGLVVHAIYWHEIVVLQSGPSVYAQKRSGLLALILPAVVGTIAVVFMLKPFFARRPPRFSPQRVRREAEPFLYEYVSAICRAVGSPEPSSIVVDCDCNASAALVSGLWNPFSRRLRLTIGLPLIAGFTTRQLTSVLAHEFGHFSQSAGMRLSGISREISIWFARVAWERDSWDEFLAGLSQGGNYLAILGWMARLFVHLSRSLVCWLYLVSELVGYYCSRHMEFDADRYSLRMVGYDTFSETWLRLDDLSIAHYQTLDDLGRFWSEGRLADDFAALVINNLSRITPEMRAKVQEHIAAQKTSWFDSHPSREDRLTSGQTEPAEGAFSLDGEPQDYPATALFHNFQRLSQAASKEFYRLRLGTEFDPKKLQPAADLVAERNAEIASFEALDRFVQFRLPALRPLPLTDDLDQPPVNLLAAIEELKRYRALQLQQLPRYKKLSRRFGHADSNLLSAVSAMALVDCKFKFAAADYQLDRNDRKTVANKLDRCRQAITHLASELLTFEQAASDRLCLALRLLHHPMVRERVPQADDIIREVALLLPDVRIVCHVIQGVQPLRVLARRAGSVFRWLGKNQSSHRGVESILSDLSKLHALLTQLARDLGDRIYPFQHSDATMTLQQFVIPQIPEENSLFGLMIVGSEVSGTLMTLYVRMFARLAVIAEQVETAVGLPQLPQPGPEGDDDKRSRKKTRRQRGTGNSSAKTPPPLPNTSRGSAQPASTPADDAASVEP